MFAPLLKPLFLLDEMLFAVPASGSSVCSKELKVFETKTTAMSMTVSAYDPDKNTKTDNAGNAKLMFKMHDGYQNSDLFDIATTKSDSDPKLTKYTGTISPKTENLDYETMYTEEGLLVGIKVFDNEGTGLSVACDMTIALVDVNEHLLSQIFQAMESKINHQENLLTILCT